MTLKYTFMFYHRSFALIIFSLGRRNPLYAEIISWFSKNIYLYVLIRTEKHLETIVTYIKLRLLTLLLKNFFLRWQACRDGLIDIVRALQQRGVPTINTLDKDGLAPIHYAARYDHKEIVQLLIEGGAGNISSGYCFIFSAIVFPRKFLFFVWQIVAHYSRWQGSSFQCRHYIPFHDRKTYTAHTLYNT